ncbi:hypothetical protein NP493_469g03030 [Ridgeia piscesae]|uniref:protein-tyrosine-phosphatase n=1 Tax=Ridgeia piscesae TaxID=27915 RepID=A0AAD9KYE3_RIDPI|nr:hypothetical protein NP493_469g03030 [Ridgeia piscesae]
MPYVKWRLGAIELTPEDSIPIGKNVLMLNNVLESANYTCVATSDLGNIDAVAKVKVKALPKPPTGLSTSEVTAESVKLTWNSGNVDPIESYTIQYKHKYPPGAPFTEITDLATRGYTILGLDAYTDYEFRVVAVNNIGRGVSSNAVFARTGEKAPTSPPQRVRARPVSSSTVVVQWTEPDKANGVIKGYKVFYTLEEDLPISLWTVHQVDNTQLTTISNLLTNRTYSIRVMAHNSVGDSPLSPTIHVKTQQGVPEQPTNLQGEATSPNMIQLVWDAPEDSGNNIRSYELYFNSSHERKPKHVSIVPPRTRYTMEDLTPNTVYHILIAAKSSRGEGASTPIIQVRTLEYKPSAPPQNVTARALSSHMIEVRWHPPASNHQNGDISGYRVMYAKERGGGGSVTQASVVRLHEGARSCILRTLEKWTQYQIWVLAYTHIGDGPRSDGIIARTDEDVPGEPRRVRVEAFNSTSIKVEWQPPSLKERNGIIRGYQVHYIEVDRHGQTTGRPQMYDLMDGDKYEVTLAKLKPDTWYQVRVAAYTRKGDGQRSPARRVKTKGAVASAPKGLQLSLQNDDPPVVSVTWQRPRRPFGELSGYRLRYAVQGDSNVEERRFQGEKYHFTSGFLERGVTYEFRVSALNSVDYGEEAVGTIRTPDGIPRGAPLNFSAEQVGSQSVKLTWNPPAKSLRYGEVIMYEIRFHKLKKAVDVFEVNATGTTQLIDALELNQDYIFQIRAYTSKGAGPWSNRLPLKMTGQLPPPPQNVKLVRKSPTTIEVSWEQPRLATIIGYRVYYNMYALPNMADWMHLEIGPYTVTEIGGLEPHSSYAVRVQAKLQSKSYGNYSDIVVTNTVSQEHPQMVKEFHSKTQNPKSVMLAWKHPKTGGVARYKIVYEGIKRYRDSYGIEQTMIDPKKDSIVPNDETSLYIDGLVPKTIYSFNISAKYSDGSWGPEYMLKVETSIDAPPAIDRPSFLRTISDNSILLRLRKASEKHGPISHYYVVVVPEGIARQMNPDDFNLEDLHRVKRASETGQQSWIAARFNNDLPPEFELGDGTRPGTGQYFNRPLEKGALYRVFVRAYTTGNKFTSTPYSEPLSTDYVDSAVGQKDRGSGLGLLWIVGPVCAAVVLILFIALLIVCFRRRTQQKEKDLQQPVKMVVNDMPAHPTDPVELRRINFQTQAMVSHPPIAIAELADHIERLKANEGVRFSQEYESIEPGQQFTWDNSNMEVNKPKNRYANVIAYDHSRIILQSVEGVPGSDYINSNYMDGYRKHNAYIATQGPLPETFSDFWRMVWEQRSATVVMMTKLEERARIKCDQYWPNRGTETYGVMHVTLVDVMELATYTIRTFQIHKNSYPEKREVRQFQFTAWPDHGVPDHPTPLLLFMRRVKALTPPDSGPMIIHCSAGVGRTGAFIVIDSMLERIKHEKTVDIYGHVTCLRAQRNYMVQTEDQYVFIHDALLEAVQSGNTEIPARSLYVHIQKLTQPEPGETVTGMELEFKRLANVKANPSRFVSANLAVNKFKNRLVNILPYESTRVTLQPIRGVEGSDYINASFIDGYRYRKAYIATQGPLAETTEDFWRMLWEHNSTIIVMLTKLKEMGREKCHQYWPSERSARYQYFVVDPMAEYNMPQYILREFKVTDARDGQSRTIRQFQFTDWPEQGIPKSGEGFIDFIGQVHKTKEQFGQDGPITVHCSAGVGRTGVFTTLSIVLERMRYEGVVDMYQTVKMLRTQRPAMVQTEDQYSFCYRAALEYLGSFDHYAN